MNTTIEVQGWITDANLQSPKKRYGYPDRYQLELSPFNCYQFDEIERRVEELKERKELEYRPEYNDGYELNSSGHKDELGDGSSLLFQTLRLVNIHPELEALDDREIVGKFVKVVGHIQQYPDGNCWLSYHIVEPSFRDIPDIDPDEPGDDTDW